MRIEYARNGMPQLADMDRWLRNPIEGLEQLVRLFDEEVEGAALNVRRLAADLFEDEANVFARFEVPGTARENIAISFDKGELGVRVEASEEGSGEKVLKAERKLEVPVEIRSEEISASLKDGILTVTMPKSEKSRARTIEIN